MSWFGWAQQSTLLAVQKQVAALQTQVGKLMSQDSTLAAIAAAIQADVTRQSAALGVIQGIVTTLQNEVNAGGASPATVAALQAAQAAEDAFTTSIESAEVPPTGGTPPAGG